MRDHSRVSIGSCLSPPEHTLLLLISISSPQQTAGRMSPLPGSLPDSTSRQTKITYPVIAWFFLVSSLSLELYKGCTGWGCLVFPCISRAWQSVGSNKYLLNDEAGTKFWQWFFPALHGLSNQGASEENPSEQLIQMGKLRHRSGRQPLDQPP